MNQIIIKDCVKIFNADHKNSVTALNGVNLEIKKGESVAIMGISGSGKTTLLKIIGCLENPTSGEYMLDGENIKDLSQNAIARLRNDKLGIVFQHNGLLDSENVKIPLLFSNKYKLREMHDTAYTAIDSTGIYDLARKKVKNLSGG